MYKTTYPTEVKAFFIHQLYCWEYCACCKHCSAFLELSSALAPPIFSIILHVPIPSFSPCKSRLLQLETFISELEETCCLAVGWRTGCPLTFHLNPSTKAFETLYYLEHRVTHLHLLSVIPCPCGSCTDWKLSFAFPPCILSPPPPRLWHHLCFMVGKVLSHPLQ